MRRLVVGDIHGNYYGLLAALDAANYDPTTDKLYGVGDYVDGHSDSQKVVEFLRKLPHFIGIIGNHDVWFKEFLNDPHKLETPLEPLWFNQGGRATLQSYNARIQERVTMGRSYFDLTDITVPSTHVDFFNKLSLYEELDGGDFCIVHAGWRHGYEGIQSSYSMETKQYSDLYWDRDFWSLANHRAVVSPYTRVFIGHTAVDAVPQKRKEVWNLDTGGGWFGRISVMDIDTEQYWQSEPAKVYYPEFRGR